MLRTIIVIFLTSEIIIAWFYYIIYTTQISPTKSSIQNYLEKISWERVG